MSFLSNQSEDTLRYTEMNLVFEQPVDGGEIDRAATVSVENVRIENPLFNDVHGRQWI